MPFHTPLAKGPRQGRTTGRLRNTLLNQQSRQNPPPPALPPDVALQFQVQRQALLAERRDVIEQTRLARRQLRAQFRAQRADIAQQRRAGISEAEQQSIAQGRLGSSTDFERRIGIKGEAEAALTSARTEMVTGRQALLLERQKAARGFDIGVAQLEAARRAAQAQMSEQLFREGFFDTPSPLPEQRSRQPQVLTAEQARAAGSQPSPFLMRQTGFQQGIVGTQRTRPLRRRRLS